LIVSFQSGRAQGSAVDHRELGEKLNRLVSRSSIGSSLPSLSSLHSSSSLNTMPSAKVADGSYSHRPALKNGLKQKSGEDRQRDIELYKILRGKKAELEELLKARINELRSVCLKEGELTGEMPQEISATLRPGEEMPKLKKRVGTSFSIPEEMLKSDKVSVHLHEYKYYNCSTEYQMLIESHKNGSHMSCHYVSFV
ncbi:hypothetical protein COOONC_09367, partial [Cooperia oncophora]